MRKIAKLAALSTFSGIFFALALNSVQAFQMPQAAGKAGAGSRQAVSAYAEDAGSVGSPRTSALSPAEVRHVSWCAARYALAYSAVDNTYDNGRGRRIECVSPK
ncbi:BA14K family protein [Rhizobium sp. XQZ8]|uniref:BA14K family protein n=1 Tax=Rhizobium populisoli TaxID=2859785 RepID=UPI001CA4E294|nr:BA14K family protein [Rhizobium populisoli]MBW6425558.1 BA14K family protein [Rhizobium populisoli]